MTARRKVRKPKPTTGQHARYRDIPFAKLNTIERRVVELLARYSNGRRSSDKICALAGCITGPSARTKLRVRNALRRLVACAWVERVGRATYRVTVIGRRRYLKVRA